MQNWTLWKKKPQINKGLPTANTALQKEIAAVNLETRVKVSEGKSPPPRGVSASPAKPDRGCQTSAKGVVNASCEEKNQMAEDRTKEAQEINVVDAGKTSVALKS